MQDPEQRHAMLQAAYHWTELLAQGDFTHSFQETRPTTKKRENERKGTNALNALKTRWH